MITDHVPLDPWAPDVTLAPPPDPDLEPDGFVVTADDGARIHFLDWGGPAGQRDAQVPGAGGTPDAPDAPGVLLIPGILAPAWTWAPVARRLARVRHTVTADLRGQGLSDSPIDGYDLSTLAADMVAVAEGSGVVEPAGVVLAGSGFGAIVAAAAAVVLGERCRGVVLADGGWERLEVTTDLDVDEFLRGLDEPPEVLRTMAAYLDDRRGYDHSTYDADQERAARDSVVETAAGHVVRAVRPHVVGALVRTMFAWDPAAPGALPAVEAPVVALVALGAPGPEPRLAELVRAGTARVQAGRAPIAVTGFADVGHNLPRYRPADVTAAILQAG